MDRNLPCLLLLALAAGPAMPASAAACWAPTLSRTDNGYGVSASSPRLAPLRAALDATEALLRADPGLAAVEGFRLQARHSFGRDEAYAKSDTATLWLRFHGPDTWAGEGCGVDQGRAGQVQVPGENTGQLWAYSPPGHDGSVPVHQVDPELLRPSSGKLRLLTISYYAHADDEAMGPLLGRWVEQFDPAQAARLLSAGAGR